jgi:predicted DNA-binding transcriptional regulator YafY
MPKNKSPHQRYQRIHELITRYSSATAVVKMSFLREQLGISQSQLDQDFRVLREEYNLPLQYDYRLKGWRYSEPVVSLDDNTLMTKNELLLLRMSIEMLDKGGQLKNFDALPGLFSRIRKASREWVNPRSTKKAIYFDPLPQYAGSAHLGFFLEAIDYNKEVQFDYRSFRADDPGKTVVLKPYFLRHYERKWYVGGHTNDPSENFVRVFPLERITNTPAYTGHFFRQPEGYDAQSYWKNIYGITIPPSGAIERVVLSFDGMAGRYFLASPFYEPFTVVEESAEKVVIALHLIPNVDLVRKLMSLADGLTILEPESLRLELANKLFAALRRHQ